jgi:hypothetical protein
MANGEMILLQGLSAAKKTLLAESQSDVLLLHAAAGHIDRRHFSLFTPISFILCLLASRRD